MSKVWKRRFGKEWNQGSTKFVDEIIWPGHNMLDALDTTTSARHELGMLPLPL